MGVTGSRGQRVNGSNRSRGWFWGEWDGRVTNYEKLCQKRVSVRCGLFCSLEAMWTQFVITKEGGNDSVRKPLWGRWGRLKP